MYLLGKMFFRLYYHWSDDIRNTFYNFMLLKINPLGNKKTVLPGSPRYLIAERYEKVTALTETIRKMRKHNHLPNDCRQEKDYYKRLKDKIQLIRKQKTNTLPLNDKPKYPLDTLLKMYEEDANNRLQAPRTTNYLEDNRPER